MLARTAALAALTLARPARAQKPEPPDNIAGPYVPTPWPIVDDMLRLADIQADDVVYDLGSGDGRLVIAASKRYGARGVGIELQTDLVEIARLEAKREGVDKRVRFLQGDLFESSVGEATVVTLYLLPRFVTRLVPKLRTELRPGARVISHDYPLVPWQADKTLTFDVEEKVAISGTSRTNLYYYVVPAPVGGQWELALPPGLAPGPLQMTIRQQPDLLEGVARAGRESLTLRELSVRADRIRFGLLYQGRLLAMEGTVTGDGMGGELRTQGRREPWSARRLP